MTDENDKSPDSENRENEAQDNEATESNESSEEPQESSEPTESEASNMDQDDSSFEKIALIQEFEHKMKLLRWGLFVGMLAVLAIGIFGLYGTTKKYAIDPINDKYTQIEDTYEELKPHIEGLEKRWQKAEKAVAIFKEEHSRLEPKVAKALPRMKDYANKESEDHKALRAAFEDRFYKEIKPAAEDLYERVREDLRDDMLDQMKELTSHSEEMMFSARQEYFKLTNSLPDQVNQAVRNQLLKTIAEREDMMREKFPKLTKEKQSALVTHLTQFPEEQGKKIFMSLFPSHMAETRKMMDSLDAIYDKEGKTAELENSMESSIALLSALLEIAMSDFDKGGVNKRKKPTTEKPEPEPAPEKPEPKKN